MNIETAKMVMKEICRRERYREALRSVAIKNGFAYATDGRIAMKCHVETPDGDCDSSYDSIPDNYPIADIDGFIGEQVSCWERVPTDDDTWTRLSRKLKSEVRRLKIEAEHDRADRYILVHCPSCGEDVYYDREEEELVETEDIATPDKVDYRDCIIPVEVDFGGESVLVNFAYLWAAKQILGSLEVGKSKRGYCAFRSRYGGGRGVLVPLRRDAIDNDREIITIDTEEIDIEKEAK